MSIAQFAVTRRVTVAMLATAIVVLGLFAIPRLAVNLLPTFTPPVVTVSITYGTVSPETMETTVTRPLENAVSRVSGIDYLQSDSYQGQSIIRATFKFGTDINVAATDIQQQVARSMSLLPNDPNLQQPVIQKADPNSFPVVRVYITDAMRPMRDLSDLYTNYLDDEFSAVAGVGSVVSNSGQTRSIMVEPNQTVLAANGLDTNAVINKIKAENVDDPAGIIPIGPREFGIRTSALYKTPQEIGDTVIAIKSGAPVYLRDVARVRDDIQEQRSFSRLDGTQALQLTVIAQPDANIVSVADGVYAKIDELKKRYPSMKFGVVFDQQSFIVEAIDALEHTAIYGAVLAILVILLFLHSWRSTLIVSVSLPISVLGTLFAAYMFHETLNVMTLGGLALAVGLIVDDAVVVIENIFRHLAEGESPLDAARKGTAQILTAVIASSVTVVTVFVPLLLIPGLQGLIFGPFAIVVMTSVAISLLVAVTTVPMLSSIMLNAEAHAQANGSAPTLGWYARFNATFDRGYNWVENRYKALLAWSLGKPAVVLGTGVALFVLALVALKLGAVKTESFPAADSRYARFDVRTPNGTSLTRTNEVSQLIEAALGKDPRAERVGVTVGTAFGGGTQLTISNQASIAVLLRPEITGAKAADFVNEWQRRLGGGARRSSAPTATATPAPLAALAALTPQQRDDRRKLRAALVGTQVRGRTIDIVQGTVSQGADALTIQLYGPDYNELYTLAQSIIPKLATIQGVIRPDTNVTAAQPEVDVHIDRRKAAQLGFSTGDIGTLISTATTGTIASYYQVNGIQYPIYVQLAQPEFKSFDALNGLQITLPAQTTTNVSSSETFRTVPLSSLAAITLGKGPSQISRQNKQRRIDITAPVIGVPLGDVVDHAKAIMDGVTLPSGYRWDFGPQIKQNNDTFGALGLVVLLAIALIYMLLASQFESFLDPLVIMMSVPLSLVGIIASLYLTNRAFGLTAFIGSLLLVGIAVKNAILVVEFTKQLRHSGMSPHKALMHAGPRRLRPILMTTLATLGGMLPLALGIEAGSSTQAPLGTVVIGGLITSTLLSLVVVPTLYLLVATHIEPRFSAKPPTLRKRETLVSPPFGVEALTPN